MPLNQDQKDLYRYGKAQGWSDDKIRSGMQRLEAPAMQGAAPIEAAPVEQPAPRTPAEEEAWRRRTFREQADANSFGQNFMEALSDVPASYARGSLQAAQENRIEKADREMAGDVPRGRAAGLGFSAYADPQAERDAAAAVLPQMQQEELAIRERLDPIRNTAGGFLGNLTGEVGMTLPTMLIPGAGVAANAGRLARLAPLLGNVAREGAVGAAYGAARPTVEGESRTGNAIADAAFGAAIPAAGAALASRPAQNFGQALMDNLPWNTNAARHARNAEAAAEIAKQNLDIDARNTAKLAQLQTAENLRSDAINATRQDAIDSAKGDLIRAAGWDRMPRGKVEAEAALKDVGQRYGDLIAPQEFDVSSVVPDIQHTVDMDMQGFKTDENRYLQSLATRLEGSASRSPNGAMAPGDTYMKLRSEIGKKLRSPDVTGEFQDTLANIRTQLDNAFDAGLDDATRGEVQKMRRQYAMGLRLNDLDWDPKTGFSLEAARKRLDKTRGEASVRENLADVIRDLPEKHTPDKISRSGTPGLEERIPFQPEAPSRWMSLGQVGKIPLRTALFFGSPALYTARGLNKPNSRKVLSAMLRAYNVSPDAAPAQED